MRGAAAAAWRSESETVTKPVAIGSDEAGYRLKGLLIDLLKEDGLEVADFGTDSEEPVDYPDVAFELAEAVARGEHDRGILICGTGIGMSIAANKIEGVRAAHCTDCFQARMARQHNDANVLCLGARVSGLGVMEDTLEAFLAHGFEGGRHAVRVSKIVQLDGRRS